MRGSRATLLLAGALLCIAEVVSLSLLLRGLIDHQADRERSALSQANPLLPRIADWMRNRGGVPGEVLNATWIAPFDELRFEDFNRSAIDDATKERLIKGELVVSSRITDRVVSLLGFVNASPSPILIRLTRTDELESRLNADRVLIAQHLLILIASMTGLGLVALRTTGATESGGSAARAYEEAMTRLRRRDDERLAAFDQERSRLTESLKDRETMARAGELTAGIVHEVRNSLGAISANANLLEKSQDSRAAGASAAIAAEVRTLQNAMTRFLDFIRTERVANDTFDLRTLIERIAARERANHTVSIETSGVPTLVKGDENLLERALENVLRNAAQAASPAGRVRVTYGSDDRDAFVIVDDDGPGIPDVSKALRPFESSKAGGLGLGLPLVLKILTLHQGTLELLSRRDGRGTQAVCRWPMTARDATNGSVPGG
jgi:signal transduction histidine kinase